MNIMDYQNISNNVWTKSEREEVEMSYFKILRITESYYEIMSRCTRHCWIIKKNTFPDCSISLYHKHSIDKPYYHKQRDAMSVKDAIKIIGGHDRYVLENKKSVAGTQR